MNVNCKIILKANYLMIFNICKLSINDFHYLFDDLIEVMVASLVDLGHECTVSINNTYADRINILIGSIIFNQELANRLLTNPCIIYQMEILDDEYGHLKSYPYYLDLLGRAVAIWEYSPSNKVFLESKGFSNILYVPPGYHPISEKILWPKDREYDFIFVGSVSERRIEFLHRLSDRGFKVAAIFEKNKAFGQKRDEIIARSKIIVNVHCFDNIKTLETVRISYLLANKALVISEESDHDPYDGSVIYAKYEDLIDCCEKTLNNSSGLEDIAENGFQAITKLDMRTIVKNAVLQLRL